MPDTEKRNGVQNNKAKSRRQAKNRPFYAAQFAVTIRNRRRKLQKHLSLQPKDIQALEALKRSMI